MYPNALRIAIPEGLFLTYFVPLEAFLKNLTSVPNIPEISLDYLYQRKSTFENLNANPLVKNIFTTKTDLNDIYLHMFKHINEINSGLRQELFGMSRNQYVKLVCGLYLYSLIKELRTELHELVNLLNIT